MRTFGRVDAFYQLCSTFDEIFAYRPAPGGAGMVYAATIWAATPSGRATLRESCVIIQTDNELNTTGLKIFKLASRTLAYWVVYWSA